MKKNIYLGIFALIAIGIGFFFVLDVKKIEPTVKEEVQQESQDEPKIGGERDEHGCLGPAGYSYNEEIGACIRDWELDDDQKTAAAMAVETILGMDTGLTIIKVERAATDDMYLVTIQKPNTEQLTVRVEDEQMEEDVDTDETVDTADADGVSDITEEIRTALFVRNGWDENMDVEVNVSFNDGEFASGSAGPTGGGPGGGGWYAAYVDGAWEIIWDGNGVIICSDLDDFEADFGVEIPSSLIDLCYDDNLGTEVSR